MIKLHKKHGFSFIELVVIIAIMAVLLAVLAPALLRYTENSRVQKDLSSMDEIVNAVQLALTDADIFDETYSYCIPNNYMTYSDSSGVYGQQIMDEEFWAPDGSGSGVTITFNPDENGICDIAEGIVNDMTYGNGSVGEPRTAEGDLKQCYFAEMGRQLLYSAVKQSVGQLVINNSATYRHSSYTVFIRFIIADGNKQASVYGAFNGTNLTDNCPAAIGSNTSSYNDNNEAIVTTPSGGRQDANFTNSDLSGGGSLSTNTPSYKPAPPPIHNDIIPAGGVYYVGVTNSQLGNYTGATAIYKEGDPFPATVKKGDVYVYGDYEYRYGKEYYTGTRWATPDGVAQIGWGVKVLSNSKTSYGAILLTIANYNIVNLSYTFENCTMLIIPPEIPETVTAMGATFRYCSSLTTAPVLPNKTSLSSIFSGCVSLKTYVGSTDPDGDFSNYKLPTGSAWAHAIFENCQLLTKPPKLPSDISGLNSAFRNCTSLTDLSDMEIPQGVTEINSIFSGCTSLEVAPNLPSNITKMTSAFANCTKLKTYAGSTSPDGDFSNYKLPDNATMLDAAFSGCESIRIAPIIPNKVTSIGSTFMNCTSLTQAPIIPDSVVNMDWTFSQCTSLQYPPAIPCNVGSMFNAFSGCTALITLPNMSVANSLKSLNQAFAGCTALTDLSHIEIPGSVTNMEGTFKNCTSLTKAPDLTNASSLQTMCNTFENCTALTTIKIIPSTVTDMRKTFIGCSSLTGTIIINGNPSYNYSNCFDRTAMPIQITGASTILNEIAASYNNVTVG